MGNIVHISNSILQVAETQANHIEAIEHSNVELEKQAKNDSES